MHTSMIRCFALIAFLGGCGLSSAQNNLPAWDQLPECKGQDIYQGVNCFGSFDYDNGHKYVGQFKNGKRHGLGTFTWAGNKYAGQFEDDDFNGSGTLTYANGSMYFGQFLANKSEGQGVYSSSSSSGRIFVGEFINDEVGKKAVRFDKTKKFPMIEVINACETQSNSNFIAIAACIKFVYGQVGTLPSSRDVKNFISLLDGVSEDFNKKTIGFAKSKAEMIKAWQSTIDASNKRGEDATSAKPNYIPSPIGGAGGGIDSFTRNQMYQDCLRMAARDLRTCIP